MAHKRQPQAHQTYPRHSHQQQPDSSGHRDDPQTMAVQENAHDQRQGPRHLGSRAEVQRNPGHGDESDPEGAGGGQEVPSGQHRVLCQAVDVLVNAVSIARVVELKQKQREECEASQMGGGGGVRFMSNFL